jgi:TRAP-type C4-dicarboxylate transport system permease large subunit
VDIANVFRSSMPFLGIGFLLMVLITIFPQIVLWLPCMMAR